jgi:hypothetical protein
MEKIVGEGKVLNDGVWEKATLQNVFKGRNYPVIEAVENNVVVFDNGGKSIDRYTLINTVTGDMYGSNNEPYHPQGFGQYAGNIKEFIERGTGLVKSIKAYVNLARRRPSWLGKEVDLKTLPLDVQKLAKEAL